MIDVTVKTLDSQNHAFSLADDITVREFKEHIAESVSVPADSQRLIYCGRVLQDEKKLNDYDVNGKVIHLVQRAPPQPGQRGNNGGQSTQGQGWHNAQGGVYRHTRSHVHGNAMYIGTMAIPAQSVDGRGIPVQRLTSTLSGGRLGLIRRTLTRVNQIVDRLDDPNSPPNPSPPEASSSPLPHHVHVQEIDPEPVDGENGGNNGGSRLAYAATAAMAAVLQAARLNNVTDLRGNGDESGGSSATGSGNVTEEDQNAESQQQPQDPEDQATSNGEGQNNRQFNALSPMSELLERLLSTQDRLRPYIERYRTLMQTDPALSAGSGPEGVEENQRIVDGVSESLHNLSHACHALSDFIVDMSEEPPRSLSCRPILVQHSAILQTGIPIQVEAHISLQGRNANNNNNTRNEENSSDTASAPSAAAPDANASSEPTVTVNIDSSPGGTTAAQPTSDTNVPSDPIDLNESDPIPLPFGTAYNLAGNGSVEVLMEVTPEGSMETGGNGGEENQQNRNNNNNNTGGPNGATPVMSWSTTSPPNFLRNLLQAVAGHVVQGHVVQGGIATTSAAPSNTFVLRDGRQGVAVAVDSNPNPGQSTQARNNVGTHPTTATQTRSTSRPHVFHHHTHPLGNGISIGAGGFDDPFLPCNSHHVRRTPMTSSSTINVNISQQGQATPSAPAAEPQTSSQSASTCSNATTSTPQTTKANSPLVNHSCSSRVRHISANATGGQPHINISAEGGDLGQNLRNALLMLVSGNQDGFFSRSNITSNLTLADLLQSSGVGAEFFTSHESGQEENLLVDLSIVLVRNITLDGLRALRYGQSEPIAVLRRPLREFFQCYFPRATSTTTVQEVTVDRFLSQLRPHLRNILQAEECTISQTSNRIDIIATAENILRRHIADALRHLYDEHCSDETFGQEILCIVSNLGFQLCTVLRYYLRGGQAGLEAVALRFASDEMEGTHETLRHFVLNTILARFRAYTLRMVQPPDSVILPFLIYKDTTIPTSTPSASVQQTSTATQQQQQSQQQLPKPELMETDSVEDRTSNAESLPVDDAEVPETFPGHENLPSDWVPIIARDSVKQRRQFQNMIAGGVPTLSDAYLGGLPSKRRKTIEQQKPRLLASPTPNRSAIAASVERLVREGVTRAGVEEIDGATVAVASDPGVRRAFGQAIRDCLTPRRYRTPDFPDPLRFPNASKFFSEGRSPK